MIGSAFLLPLVLAAAPAGEVSDTDLFRKQVWPLLQRACLTCHGEDDPENNLRVDSREALLQGGKTGPAVKLGAPNDSLFLQVVRWNHKDMVMPPKRKLPDREVALLETWVRRGLPWPAPEATKGAPAVADATGPRWTKAWWTGLPRRAEAIQTTEDDIDRFVAAELTAVGIEPLNPADRRCWLRRVTYALTGLLPTEAETRAFMDNKSDDRSLKTEALDRLLASPAYGKRWAHVWQRQALPGISDNKSVQSYVVWLADAFNKDSPMDSIVRAHVGGSDPGARSFQSLAAARPSPDQSPEAARVAVVGRTFLALEVDCARCHDHPVDPLRRSDYQALSNLVFPPDQGSAPGPAVVGSDLTRSLALKDNPLLARVLVNRVWREHLGAGLVSTVDEFGARGDVPSNRPLLDHLAATWIANGGSMKWLHRRILLSATFGRAITRGSGQKDRDPDNVFLWRANPRSIEAAALHESQKDLAVTMDIVVPKTATVADRIWLRASRHKKTEAAPSASASVQQVYKLLLGRDPSPTEKDAATAFLAAKPNRGPLLVQEILDGEEFRVLL